ncbi:LexA family protein [Paenibacillus durus]|uniref:LexA family protein n=1 Tax=Paenibacillus durus TaxID=44251 RepID=UPI00046F4E9D|nr:winged helix DNA-binding protein [Paenibacillus durus]
MTDKNLTPQQARTLEVIQGFITKKGYPPTVREVAQLLNLQSSSTAFRHIELLCQKGYISKSSDGPRTIRVKMSVKLQEKGVSAEELEQVLKFYADRLNWEFITDKSAPVLADGGERARAILKKYMEAYHD